MRRRSFGRRSGDEPRAVLPHTADAAKDAASPQLLLLFPILWPNPFHRLRLGCLPVERTGFARGAKLAAVN